MTRSYLDLSVAIGEPIDVLALLRECRRLLGTPDAVPPLLDLTESPLLPYGRGRIAHPVFWDFPATCSIGYGINGPMTVLPPADADLAHRRSLAADPVRNGWARAEVHFAPFVGWNEISGNDAARDRDLGAWLIRELGRWLDRQRLPWQWEANGASVYLPYSMGAASLSRLGDPSLGEVTSETAARTAQLYLAGWQRRWDGPGIAEGALLEGWQS
uniref:hypothetical protein n=1 Tax=Amycolatopsis sp. CA-096443 TaxID=3239919 RepID=UPI003F49143C